MSEMIHSICPPSALLKKNMFYPLSLLGPSKSRVAPFSKLEFSTLRVENLYIFHRLSQNFHFKLKIYIENFFFGSVSDFLTRCCQLSLDNLLIEELWRMVEHRSFT